MAINTLSLMWRKMLSFIEDPIEAGETAIKVVMRNALDVIGDVLRTSETDPLNLVIAPDYVADSGLAAGTYPYYFDMTGYNTASIDITPVAGANTISVAIWATVDSYNDDLTARTYRDITTAITGGASITTAGHWPDTTRRFGNYTAFKIVATVTGAASDSAITAHVKRAYI